MHERGAPPVRSWSTTYCLEYVLSRETNDSMAKDTRQIKGSSVSSLSKMPPMWLWTRDDCLMATPMPGPWVLPNVGVEHG